MIDMTKTFWAATAAAVSLGLLLAAGPASAASAMYVDGYKTKQDCQRAREWHLSQGRNPGPCVKESWYGSWGFSY
jgi:hypothetical protein